MRASISCSSMNSPRSACAMPFCTAAETGILLRKAQGSFTSRSASRTGMVGDLGKLRYLLGSEMDFHTPFNGRESSRSSQRAILKSNKRSAPAFCGVGEVGGGAVGLYLNEYEADIVCLLEAPKQLAARAGAGEGIRRG